MSPTVNLAGIALPAIDTDTLRFDGYLGGRVILLLGNQHTGTGVRELAGRIQADPALAGTPIVQVAHLVGVPRLFHRLAERDIRQGYRAQRAESATAGPDHAGVPRLAMGLDWTGDVTVALGYSGKDRHPFATVVDEAGRALGRVPESDPLAGLRELLATPSTADRPGAR